jgi:hypothetical protein
LETASSPRRTLLNDFLNPTNRAFNRAVGELHLLKPLLVP